MNNANMPACMVQIRGELNAKTMEVGTLVQSHTDWLITSFFMERSSSLQQEELTAGMYFAKMLHLIF